MRIHILLMTMKTENIEWKMLASKRDDSVNFIHSKDNLGTIEARFVRRPEEDAIVVYLSSQTGCNQSCRMCHLTATGQTHFRQMNAYGFTKQAETVLNYYSTVYLKSNAPVSTVKFDFMARGEPLLNTDLLDNFGSISKVLTKIALFHGLEAVFNISTIMPRSFGFALNRVFINSPVRLYYSLYSMNSHFRKRWLPKAMDPYKALGELASFRNALQQHEVILHWAFIEGENDDYVSVAEVVDAVLNSGLASPENRIQVNIVRFNPPPGVHYQESSEPVIQERFNYLRGAIGNSDSKVVTRVGTDVAASCGMFVNA